MKSSQQHTSRPVSFSESQHIGNPQLWILISFLVLAGGLGLYMFARQNLPVALTFGIVCLVGVASSICVMLLSFKTIVQGGDLNVQLYPFSSVGISVARDEIIELHVLNAGYIQDILVQNSEEEKALPVNFVANSKFAVKVVTTSGVEILVGTNKPGALFRALCR